MPSTPLEFTLRSGRVWTTTVVLPFWKGFQSRRGPYGSQDGALPSDGTVELIFAPEGRGTEPLTQAELAAVEWVIENEAPISKALVASLFAEYSTLQKRYPPVSDEDSEQMPNITSSDELRSLIGLHTVYVHQVQRDGLPYTGFEFGCTWEAEHGLGILMHGNRTVEIGYADTAFLAWMAERDRDRPSNAPSTFPPKHPNWPPVSRRDGWAKTCGFSLSESIEQEFFQVAGNQFSIVGPLVSRAEINAVFPEFFPGREELVEFYLRFNGGSRTPQGCIMFCANPEHETPRDQFDKLNVAGFRSIPFDANSRMLPFANMVSHHATMATIYSEIPEINAFLRDHMEIAFDHSGRDLCINRQNGKMFFMDWESYSEGPVEVASSFSEFVVKFWNVAPVLID